MDKPKTCKAVIVRSLASIGRMRLQFMKRRVGNLLKKARLSSSDKRGGETLRLEISSQKIVELLREQQLCAADLHCLDLETKQCLKKLCLRSCLFRRCGLGECADAGEYVVRIENPRY